MVFHSLKPKLLQSIPVCETILPFLVLAAVRTHAVGAELDPGHGGVVETPYTGEIIVGYVIGLTIHVSLPSFGVWHDLAHCEELAEKWKWQVSQEVLRIERSLLR
jgi:hypothetical protein